MITVCHKKHILESLLVRRSEAWDIVPVVGAERASAPRGMATVERNGNIGAFDIPEFREEDVELPVTDVGNGVAISVLCESVYWTECLDVPRAACVSREEIGGGVERAVPREVD